MHPQLSYLIATQRSAELRRDAERARLTQEDQVTEAKALTARTTIRVRLRGIGLSRLRVRRT